VYRRLYFFLWKGNKNHLFGTGFFVHHRMVTVVKGVKFISVRMSYTVLEGRWCNIIVLNVHAPSVERISANRQLGMSIYITIVIIMVFE
jgi:hypothetical protein